MRQALAGTSKRPQVPANAGRHQQTPVKSPGAVVRRRSNLYYRFVHPSIDIQSSRGHGLDGKRIALCLCGSVAVMRAPDLARLLMRHGADVKPVMSHAATELIHPNLMHWATGNPVVTQLTGEIEHVALAGNVEEKVDLIVVAPATANTIGKIAAGIDDTPVTTVVTTGLGEGIPLVLVPAMHEPMYRHPIVKENLETLARHGISIVMPRVSEGKAKIADNDAILAECLGLLAGTAGGTANAPRADAATHSPPAAVPLGALAGKHVLITAGRTVEYLDPIRVLTNNSSGRMGMALAEASLAAGAQVTVIYGKGTALAPDGARVVHVETAQEMATAVKDRLSQTPHPDVVMAAAAVGDWQPVERSEKKITTHGTDRLVIELEPTPKIIDTIKDCAPDVFLLAFRAQHGLDDEELIADATARAKKARADMIAVNDTGKPGAGFEVDTNEMYLIAQDGERIHLPLGKKIDIAHRIVQEVSIRL